MLNAMPIIVLPKLRILQKQFKGKVKLKYSNFNYATCLYDFFSDSFGVLP
jgi:hypothetical protein